MLKIEEIVKRYGLSEEEADGLDKMMSMMFCLRKYERMKLHLKNNNK